MATTLFNPTNEPLEAQHIGVTTKIEAYPNKGHMVLVDDAKARHILNILAPRGLTTLDYGDEGDAKKKKAADGRKRNKEFKIKQIVDFNQLQQQNEAKKIPYSYPTKQLKEYADEVGLDLIAPYELPNIEKKKISKLKEEVQEKNDQLQEQTEAMAMMQKQISELTNLVKTVMKDDLPEEKPNVDEEVLKFKALNKPQFTAWIKKNWNDIPTYPVQIRDEINERHLKLFDTPFPESMPV